MVSANGYQVDADAVDEVVRTMFGQIDKFGELCGQFGQLVPPVAAFGGVGSPAGIAAKTAHEMLQRAQQLLTQVLDLATNNVQTAMTNYRTNDGGGAAAHGQIESALTTSASLVQRLQATGLGAGGIHSNLQDHGYQERAGIAEVYVGRSSPDVRFQPGDLVTTANLTATFREDGRLYANGVPVQLPAGQEVRVYRPMGDVA